MTETINQNVLSNSAVINQCYYLGLLARVSPQDLEPLGRGERVFDISLLEVVGVVPGLSQALHPWLLEKAQGMDVVPNPLL